MLAMTHFGNYGDWLPPMVSVHGAYVDQLLNILHWFMGMLFIGWGTFLVYCLIRYRRRAGHSASYELPKGKISKYAEIGVALFETVLLVGFSMPVWAEYKNHPPTPEKRTEIRVVAQQFQWDFHYPGPDGKFGRTDAQFISETNAIGLDESDPLAADDIQTVNELHLPVGRDIYLRLTSMDVIHSFAIPTMRVKQDVIPGMEIPIWFKVQEDATTENIKQEMTRTYSVASAKWDRLRHLVSMEDYADKSGQVILAKGDDLGATFQDGEKKIEHLRQAGIEELVMQPRNPLEVICAQLCGNSHFKMKAQIITDTPEDFAGWMAEQNKEVEFEEDF